MADASFSKKLISERMEYLNRVWKKLIRLRYPNEIHKTLLESACTVTGAGVALAAQFSVKDMKFKGIAMHKADWWTKKCELTLTDSYPITGEIYSSLLEGNVVRIDDISSYPAMAGFPERHMKLKSFLGVPVHNSAGEIASCFIVSEKRDQIPFTDIDEANMITLAGFGSMAFELAKKLETIKQGKGVPNFSDKVSEQYLVQLTPKEIELALLIRDGKKSEDISKILNISLGTVHTHRKNVRKKLGLTNKDVNLRSFLLFISR